MEFGPVDEVDLISTVKNEAVITRSNLVALATDLWDEEFSI